MKLWTVQPIEWYEKLTQDGIIYGTESYIYDEYIFGYKWLMSRMEERIGPKFHNNNFPIWAWYQWDGINKKKPDLRSTSHFMKGVEGVRIEIEKDDKDVLLSDFSLWHFPLSYHDYIGKSEEDCNDFETRLDKLGLSMKFYNDYPLNIQIEIQKSWERIFDLNFEDSYITQKNENKVIQATFWSLSIDEIKKVDKFKNR